MVRVCVLSLMAYPDLTFTFCTLLPRKWFFIHRNRFLLPGEKIQKWGEFFNLFKRFFIDQKGGERERAIIVLFS